MRPTISVVIPARDDAPALEICLGLLSRQSVPPHEVIVVDNGSSDSTAEVARSHGARVVSEPRRGIPMAAAAGYDTATGEVIARLDADSRPGSTWLATVSRLMTDQRVDAVTGVGVFYDLPRLVAGAVTLGYLGTYYLSTHLALGHTSLWGSNMAMRTSTWQQVAAEVHRDDPELHDDLDLAFVLGPEARIRLHPGLRVGVSGRSVRGVEQLKRRFHRAVRTLRINWAVQPPWLRWRDRLTRSSSR